MILHQRLSGHARFQPDAIAIQSEDGVMTYQQLLVLSEQCQQYFMQCNLQHGDRVAILAMNHPDYFIALFAAARLGVILVPLNWRLSVDELLYVIDDCDPALLLHDAEFSGTATQLSSKNAKLKLQLIGSPRFPPALDSIDGIDESSDQSDQPLLIVYTSGTTGRPKGAVLSQQALLCSALMSHHMLDMTPADRVLNVLPLFHVGGLNIQPLPALLCGATLVLHSRFEPNAAVKALEEDRITLVNSVPTLLQAIINSEKFSSADLSLLRAVSIGSTDVPVVLINQLAERNIPLIQIYGATETAPAAIYQRIEHCHIKGSIGRAGLLCDVRLMKEDGIEAGIGESGEIQVKGQNILSHYWNNPKATAASINDGWFGTGDVAHRDADGFYWFDDRLKHVVISGGENIYPAELERVIRELPGVAEVAVVGKADERWGEVPVAVVVRSGSVSAGNIIDGCEAIARFKRPREVIFVDELPRNALGKIQVPRVKELVAQHRW